MNGVFLEFYGGGPAAAAGTMPFEHMGMGTRGHGDTGAWGRGARLPETNGSLCIFFERFMSYLCC